MFTTHTPHPPIGRWERVSRAAYRSGMTKALFLAELEQGKLHCRVARLGRRGMLHVSSNDLDRALGILSGSKQ